VAEGSLKCVNDGVTKANAARPLQVMIVEDDDDSRDLLGELIVAFGYQAVGARNGDDALRQIATVRPDVALIDIGLPDMDGFEVARRVRAALGATPIRLVALTGYSDHQTRASAKAAGFDDYMIKPVPPEVLEAMLAATPVHA